MNRGLAGSLIFLSKYIDKNFLESIFSQICGQKNFNVIRIFINNKLVDRELIIAVFEKLTDEETADFFVREKFVDQNILDQSFLNSCIAENVQSMDIFFKYVNSNVIGTVFGICSSENKDIAVNYLMGKMEHALSHTTLRQEAPSRQNSRFDDIETLRYEDLTPRQRITRRQLAESSHFIDEYGEIFEK